jgi:hypothetical protein
MGNTNDLGLNSNVEYNEPGAQALPSAGQKET